MSLIDIARQFEKYAMDNSPRILTGIAVAGTITTAYLAHKAGVETGKVLIIDEEVRRRADLPEATFIDKVNLVWPEYLPAVGTGALTIACIIGASRIGSRRAAAVAAAYSLSERAFAEYKEKVVENIGEKKLQKIYDDLAQSRVDRDPVSTREVIITGNGDVMCYDSLTGRYFMGSMETIRKAENEINKQVLNNSYASLTQFYDKLGLTGTAFSEEVGWNYDNMLEVHFSTCISDDGRPCLSIDYVNAPVRKYYKLQ